MFSDRTLAVLGGIANTSRPTRPQRVVAISLEPSVRDAARGLSLAADALTGPDPEAGVMFLLDALRDLAGDLNSAAVGRPRP